MNAPHPISPMPDNLAWDCAIQAVNAWRGQAIECFSRAEFAVTETLLDMSAIQDRGSKVSLQRLAGQRFKALEKAIAADGPFAVEGELCRTPLAAFREHDTLRTCLCHGTAKVFLGRGSDWLVTFKMITLGSRESERTSKAFDRQEAEELLGDLKKRRKQLESALRQLRETIGQGT